MVRGGSATSLRPPPPDPKNPAPPVIGRSASRVSNTTPGPRWLWADQELEDAMRKALQRGLLVLLAAGVLAVPAVANGRALIWDQYRPDAGSDRRDGRELDVVGLTTDGRLVKFDADRPGRTRSIGRVKGLKDGDQSLVGIDYRVQDGKLYGVGNAGGIYTLDTQGAGAAKVSRLTQPLMGNAFGVDFNPAANRLRVVSDAGQNLRHNLDDAAATTPPLAGMTAVDASLTYPPATTPAAGISGAAYTNNDLDANTGTTLFDLDTVQDQVAVQSPANNGLLALTGKLLVDAGTSAGFDVYSRVSGGSTQGNQAFASLQTLGRYAFYQVNLLTGKITRMGSFQPGDQVFDIALPLDQG
jgi:Domain of unknown function (DUF4394)